MQGVVVVAMVQRTTDKQIHRCQINRYHGTAVYTCYFLEGYTQKGNCWLFSWASDFCSYFPPPPHDPVKYFISSLSNQSICLCKCARAMFLSAAFFGN